MELRPEDMVTGDRGGKRNAVPDFRHHVARIGSIERETVHEIEVGPAGNAIEQWASTRRQDDTVPADMGNAQRAAETPEPDSPGRGTARFR